VVSSIWDDFIRPGDEALSVLLEPIPNARVQAHRCERCHRADGSRQTDGDSNLGTRDRRTGKCGDPGLPKAAQAIVGIHPTWIRHATLAEVQTGVIMRGTKGVWTRWAGPERHKTSADRVSGGRHGMSIVISRSHHADQKLDPGELCPFGGVAACAQGDVDLMLVQTGDPTSMYEVFSQGSLVRLQSSR
jgi:hypothetical protein